jgi:hypothetical protein
MKLGIAGVSVSLIAAIAACYACTVAIDPCSSKRDNCSASIEILCVQIVLPNGDISTTCADGGPADAGDEDAVDDTIVASGQAESSDYDVSQYNSGGPPVNNPGGNVRSPSPRAK